VTPAPDGTIEIAHDVILVGSVSGYSPNGTLFAFTARPADGTTGPDVYVWRTTEREARPVTSDHGSLFSAWIGERLLVSRVADGRPMTVKVDPATGEEQAVRAAPMWRPTVSADGRILGVHADFIMDGGAYTSLGIATTILFESSLSYIGLGVQPPTPSWGQMISEGQPYYLSAPHLVIYPGLAIMITVLAFNLVGDGLRDAFDPQQRRR